MSDAELTADDLTLPIKRTEGDTLEDRLTGNAYHNILPARYLRKDANGDLVESPEDLFERVAKNIALAEAVFEADKQDIEVTVTPDQLKPGHPRRDELAAEVFGAGTTAADDAETTLSVYNVNKFAYDTVVPELPDSVRDHVEETADSFREQMERLSFMPNSPTLMNAGDELQQLSACFVDSPGDDIDTHNSFAEALEEARELIDEDGKVPKHLRNAVEGHLSNFNISVGITDDFMEAYKNGEEFTFTNPRTEEPHIATAETKELYSMFDLGEHVEVGEELSIPAEKLFERIVQGAHENGEPGVIYLERVNKEHSFDVEEHPDHQILATNPCGEQPLEEYEACNLGHINLSTLAALDAPDYRVWADEHADEYDSQEAAIDAFLEEALDIDELDHRIELGTRFLENVVTMSDFPVEKIEQKVREMRKIGLGIMGLAQLYIQLGVEYGSPEANEIARQVMRHINHGSKRASRELAESRGVFDEWDNSKYANPTEYREWFEKQTGEDADDWAEGFPIRNHNTTTIAPTGTTSMIGNTTGGCEPIYNVAYYKNVSDDVQGDEMLVEFDDYFLRARRASTPPSRRPSTPPTNRPSRTPPRCSSTSTTTAARASPTTATAPAASRC